MKIHTIKESLKLCDEPEHERHGSYRWEGEIELTRTAGTYGRILVDHAIPDYLKGWEVIFC